MVGDQLFTPPKWQNYNAIHSTQGESHIKNSPHTGSLHADTFCIYNLHINTDQ